MERNYDNVYESSGELAVKNYPSSVVHKTFPSHDCPSPISFLLQNQSLIFLCCWEGEKEYHLYESTGTFNNCWGDQAETEQKSYRNTASRGFDKQVFLWSSNHYSQICCSGPEIPALRNTASAISPTGHQSCLQGQTVSSGRILKLNWVKNCFKAGSLI